MLQCVLSTPTRQHSRTWLFVDMDIGWLQLSVASLARISVKWTFCYTEKEVVKWIVFVTERIRISNPRCAGDFWGSQQSVIIPLVIASDLVRPYVVLCYSKLRSPACPLHVICRIGYGTCAFHCTHVSNMSKTGANLHLEWFCISAQKGANRLYCIWRSSSPFGAWKVTILAVREMRRHMVPFRLLTVALNCGL